MGKPEPLPEAAKRDRVTAEGGCVCGAVKVEIVTPAMWAWHDHSAASRHAQGCAYATYVGSWKSRFQILEGADHLTRYEDPTTGAVRSFCARCGTPVLYERPRAPKMINLPRALFRQRTGREPRYHMFLAEAADWTYLGAPLASLKGYPDVMWERPKRKKKRPEGMF
jgi:hypothetical protein